MARKVRCSCGRTFWVSTPQMGKAQCLCGALHAPQLFDNLSDSGGTVVSLSVPGELGPESVTEEESFRLTEAAEPQTAASTSPASGGTVFSSKKYGYSFSVSGRGWRRSSPKVERKRGADVAVQHADIGLIKCVVSECKLDVNTVYERLGMACEIEVEDFKLISKSKETVAGCPGAVFEYEGNFAGGDGTKYKIIRYAFLRGGLLFQVLGPAPSKTFKRLKDETIAAVASFVFDNGGGNTS